MVTTSLIICAATTSSNYHYTNSSMTRKSHGPLPFLVEAGENPGLEVDGISTRLCLI